MKFLITGARGQLGQAFRKLFDQLDIEYILTDIIQLDEEHHYLDITNLDEVQKFLTKNPVDCIINCAAYNDVDKAETDWKTANLVNGDGPKNLAIASKEIGSLIVHYSTDYVFDGTKNSPYTTKDIPKPVSKYGESKLLGEKLVQQFSSNYYLIRISWLFGKGQVNFPVKVIRWSQNRNDLKIVDDQISSPSFTTDIARTTLDLLESRKFGLYHITNSEYCSRFEWAEYILNQIAWTGNLVPAKSSDFETAATRPSFSVLDNRSIENQVGYKLRHWKDATSEFLKQIEII